MRLLTALLALLIALSVVAAPLPAGDGDAHASGGRVHGEFVALGGAGACETGSVHDYHQHQDATRIAAAGPCGDAADQVGCCEMAMCHPFISVRGVEAHRVQIAAPVSGAWGADALVDDGLSARIERPPRA